MKPCIDLQAMFGHQYLIEHDPAYKAEYGEGGRTHDPWLVVIPCRHGHIYPHGGEFLGVASKISKRRGPTCKKLAAIAGLTLTQDGDDGINAKFHVSLLPTVAAIVRPKRKQQLTPEQKAAAVERLSKYRFRPADQSSSEDVGCDPAA